MGGRVHLLRRPPGCAAGKIACILIRYMFYHKEYTTLWIKHYGTEGLHYSEP